MSTLEDSWRSKLQAHEDNLLFSISSENLNYIQFHRALALQDAPNPSLTLMATGIPDQVDTKTNDINVTAAKKQKEVYEIFQSEVEILKKRELDELTRKASLNRKKDELRQKDNETIDESFREADQYISKLSNEQRAPVAKVFEAGASLVAEADQHVFRKIKEVISAIADFLNSVWNSVTIAYNAVEDFVSGIIRRIIGNYIALQAPEPTSESGVFKKSTACNQSICFRQAAAYIETVCQTLDLVFNNVDGPKPDYNILSQSMNMYNGKSTANVLFKVTTHASVLKKHFGGLFEKVSPGNKITWSTRDGSKVSPPVNDNKSF